MGSFLARRLRNIVAFKIGVPVVVTTVVLLSVFMVVAAAWSAVMAPVDAAKNAVSSFFSLDMSAEDELDVAACVGVDAVTLTAWVETVPARTDVLLAWAWIAYRAEESARGITEPYYESLAAFRESPHAPPVGGDGALPAPESRYELAATAAVLELIDRQIISAPDDLVADLTVPLVDHCHR